jgi:demethylmenaquinone methyltransferase/2-methoxy-6-polyprenyl-1,4-benzoquinol methylase
MNDATNVIQRLLTADPLRGPLLRKIVRGLQLPPGSSGLDAGCGIGLQALLLAEAVGPDGHITGLDSAPELLAYGRDRVRQVGCSERITFTAGDVADLRFADDSFDWVWSADCVGYPAGELAPVLQEFMRVVRPGGRIILLGWSGQQLLPGHPVLEARLNATCSAYLPYLAAHPPEWQFARAPHWFREAGLQHVQVRTVVSTVQAPLNDALSLALLELFSMLWGQPQPEVSPQDWEAYQRLCTLGSGDCILDLPDYAGFFTYLLVEGTVPAADGAPPPHR